MPVSVTTEVPAAWAEERAMAEVGHPPQATAIDSGLLLVQDTGRLQVTSAGATSDHLLEGRNSPRRRPGGETLARLDTPGIGISRGLTETSRAGIRTIKAELVDGDKRGRRVYPAFVSSLLIIQQWPCERLVLPPDLVFREQLHG